MWQVVFTDAGKGHIGGLDDIHLADGLYYHTAMLDGGSNQLTEMISPALIFEQLWALAANASSLFYIVINTSDMLPVPLSTAAALKFAWDPSAFVEPERESNDWNATQLAFLTEWCTEQFGAGVAADAAALYADYFAIPHVSRGLSDEWIGASLGRLAGGGTSALRSSGSIDNATTALAQAALAAASPSAAAAEMVWAGATSLLPRVPAHRQQFYKRHLVWNAACQHFGVVAISELANSLLAADVASAAAHANASLAALDSLFEAQREGEGRGEWSGLFFGDRLPYTTLQSRRRSVLGYQAALLRHAATFDSGKGYYSFCKPTADCLCRAPLTVQVCDRQLSEACDRKLPAVLLQRRVQRPRLRDDERIVGAQHRDRWLLLRRVDDDHLPLDALPRHRRQPAAARSRASEQLRRVGSAAGAGQVSASPGQVHHGSVLSRDLSDREALLGSV